LDVVLARQFFLARGSSNIAPFVFEYCQKLEETRSGPLLGVSSRASHGFRESDRHLASTDWSLILLPYVSGCSVLWPGYVGIRQRNIGPARKCSCKFFGYDPATSRNAQSDPSPAELAKRRLIMR
jgi:hypothetical protein